MKRTRPIPAVVITAVLLSGLAYWYFARVEQPLSLADSSNVEIGNDTASYPVKKVIRYSFTLKNVTNEVVEDAKFMAYAPVTKTNSQRVKDVRTNHPYSSTVDDVGNQVLRFNIKSLAPYATWVVTITAEVELAKSPNTDKENAFPRYLAAEKYIELNNKTVKALSERLSDRQKVSIAETVYRWVANNVEQASYTSEDKGAVYALEQGKGDCTEFMYLSLALLRNNQVPARGIGGFMVKENGVLGAGDYHNWVEYRGQDRWRILDAQEQVFDSNYENYIAFRIFGVNQKDALSRSQRFMAHDSRLSVRMN